MGEEADGVLDCNVCAEGYVGQDWLQVLLVGEGALL
jgi:hypothetical protein